MLVVRRGPTVAMWGPKSSPTPTIAPRERGRATRRPVAASLIHAQSWCPPCHSGGEALARNEQEFFSTLCFRVLAQSAIQCYLWSRTANELLVNGWRAALVQEVSGCASF